VAVTATDRRKIGRNELCPCGSGKKFKKCGGAGESPEKATGGRLAETLDRILEPRVAPGKPGRPKGAPNYQWTPEMDKVLIEFRTRYDLGGTAPAGWLAKAKNVMAGRLVELCSCESRPRKDSLRGAVERRLAFLGLSSGVLAKRRSLTRRSVLKRRRRKSGPRPGPPLRSPHYLERSVAI
jgi:hypothetical protein